MGYPHPYFCLCAFLGPYLQPFNSDAPKPTTRTCRHSARGTRNLYRGGISFDKGARLSSKDSQLLVECAVGLQYRV